MGWGPRAGAGGEGAGGSSQGVGLFPAIRETQRSIEGVTKPQGGSEGLLGQLGGMSRLGLLRLKPCRQPSGGQGQLEIGTLATGN